jgi:hypothetical protein
VGFRSINRDVRGGRFHTSCPRCSRKRWIGAQPGIRTKIIRCSCGQSASYTLNPRQDSREVTSGKATATLSNGRECPAYLCDTSMGGIGFTIAPQYVRSLKPNQEIMLKYRSAGGGMSQRKVRVASINGGRIGCQYVDALARLRSSF